ncbi:adenosine deaminase [Pseudohaliea rubra]|uniref:Adenosine deaminase n=1 Tax=Pseudohaliea rubra DSM 19751 TaxID=1265313 RepID=A0A095XZ34_9GAMM|nr:adenosine deaminase [Pseudohaliea rubra]KGE05011.1 Adenosine deaminase [Pseudohaliea rubra DSM 19751]
MEATHTASTLAERLQTLPKVELHNHLEGGAMYPDLALRLAARNGITLPFHDAESAAAYYRFSSLDQFIDILRTTVATLNTAEDYADAVERQGIEARRQNIRYHELFVTYGLVSRRGVPWEAVVEGLIEGRRRNAERHGVDTAFIIDLDRTLPGDAALAHVELALAARERAGIVGLGLDCQEAGYPAGRLKHCFAAAAEAGLPLTAHAGEDGGAASIWDALDCGVARIDHGVQAVEDPSLLAVLAEREILLTVCPLSNVALQVFPSLADHTLPQLLAAGIPLCLNSDDPPMFDSDLLTECEAVEAQFGLGEALLVELLRNAVAHSFQPAPARTQLLADFDAAATALGHDRG